MHLRRVLCALLTVSFSVAACGASTVPPPWRQLVQLTTPLRWRSSGTDTFEVWICRVPTDTTASMYSGFPLRRPLRASVVAAQVGRRVTPYYAELSHGKYRPVFGVGGDVLMTRSDTPDDCIREAISRSAPTTRAVLAVADAEHAPGQPGGFGSGGTDGGDATSRPASATHRYAYVGAADFSPSFGDDPPMDLVEHEIGHTLGWVHSGVRSGSAAEYLSALDVMSNSAAPREAFPARRDGQDTLAIDRFIAGWLPASAVIVASSPGSFRLAPSSGQKGERLLVLAGDPTSFVTVELLTRDGFDAHLPTSGFAVHRVTITDGAMQPIEAMNGDPPYTALLTPGRSLDVGNWRIRVLDGDPATVAVDSLGNAVSNAGKTVGNP